MMAINYDRIKCVENYYTLALDEEFIAGAGRVTHVDKFMDDFENAMEEISDHFKGELYVQLTSNMVKFYDVYEESDEAYKERIAFEEAHAAKVQRDADSSWERQKRKFARARNKKVNK